MNTDECGTFVAALERLENAEGEMALDLSNVQRLDPAGLRAIEQLAVRAREKGVRVTLGGVNVDIYRVLKLAQLSPRFQFLRLGV